jgi:alcohol dehydrogenase
MENFSFSTARKIIFGMEAVQQLSEELQKLGAKKIAVITDKGVEQSGILDKVVAQLLRGGFDYTVWDEAETEPSVAGGEEAIKFVRAGEYDSVIGLGGGSVIDNAKVASISITNPGTLSDWLKDSFEIPLAPLVLMPTTAGTGSEVSNAVAFSTPQGKAVLFSPLMFPALALVEPEFTRTVPAAVTANAGVDAFCNGMEAYVSLNASPITDAFALQTMQLVAENLKEAYACGDNMEARSNMSLAALMGGLAFGNAGTVLGHACAYAYSYPATDIHLPHGYAVAVITPYTMEYNAIANPLRYAHIAEILGEPIEGMSLRDASLQAAIAFKKLLKDLDIPASIKATGVTRDMIPVIAKNVFQSPAHIARNPRKVTEEGMVRLFEHAYEGILDCEQ